MIEGFFFKEMCCDAVTSFLANGSTAVSCAAIGLKSLWCCYSTLVRQTYTAVQQNHLSNSNTLFQRVHDCYHSSPCVWSHVFWSPPDPEFWLPASFLSVRHAPGSPPGPQLQFRLFHSLLAQPHGSAIWDLQRTVIGLYKLWEFPSSHEATMHCSLTQNALIL